MTAKTWSVGTLTYTKASLVGLFGWLLWGDFAWALKERALGPIIQIMLGQFQASSALAGFLIGTVPAAVIMLLGPIVSYRSDRHRGPRGRRIPYLLAPTPIATLALLGLASCAWLGGWLHGVLGAQSPGLNASRLIFFALFWTLFEIASVISNAVYGGLINDVVPTKLLGRFYGLFRTISLGVGIVFGLWVMAYVEAHHALILAVAAVVFGAGFTLMCFKVKEGEYEAPPPTLPASFRGFVAAAKTYLRECFANPFYRLYFLAFATAALAGLPYNTFGVLYAKSVGMSMADLGKLGAASFTISLAIAYLLGSLADRFHPLRLGLICSALYAVFGVWAGLYAGTEFTFTVATVVHTVLTGAWGTSTASLHMRIFPQIRFAQFAAAAGIMTSVLTIVLSPAVGWVLDLTGQVYRYTFLMGAAVAAAGFVLLLLFHQRFMKLGGTQAYVAPAD